MKLSWAFVLTALVSAALSLPCQNENAWLLDYFSGFGSNNVWMHGDEGFDDRPDVTATTSDSLNKIVGGKFAQRGEFPWQASMKSLGVSSGRLKFSHMCGASILSEFWLLSAAHCYYPVPYANWQVTVGEYHLYNGDEGEQQFEVQSIYNHHLFNKTTYDYDIALIQIKPKPNGRGIQFSHVVKPVYLPSADTVLSSNMSVIVSGWGGTNRGPTAPQTASPILKKGILPIVSNAQCQKTQKDAVTDRMFCAGHGKDDSCQGDSGGPAVYKSISGHYVLYGVVSWGDGCGQLNSPGGYASVVYFLDWITFIISVYS